MRLKINTQNTTISVLAENIVFKAESDHKMLFEISCSNMDTYRFSLSYATTKEAKRFKELCEGVIDAMNSDRRSFSCSFSEFPNIKFEKSARCSSI